MGKEFQWLKKHEQEFQILRFLLQNFVFLNERNGKKKGILPLSFVSQLIYLVLFSLWGDLKEVTSVDAGSSFLGK